MPSWGYLEASWEHLGSILGRSESRNRDFTVYVEPSSESSFEDDDWTVTPEQRKTRPKLEPTAGADGDDPAADMIKVDQAGPHFTGPAAGAPAS